MVATDVGTVMADRAPLIRARLRAKKPSVNRTFLSALSCCPCIIVPNRLRNRYGNKFL